MANWRDKWTKVIRTGNFYEIFKFSLIYNLQVRIERNRAVEEVREMRCLADKLEVERDSVR